VQGYKIERGRRRLTESVGSQEQRYVIEVVDLYVHSGQGSSVREVALSSNIMR
jgi:hypothetical protein